MCSWLSFRRCLCNARWKSTCRIGGASGSDCMGRSSAREGPQVSYENSLSEKDQAPARPAAAQQPAGSEPPAVLLPRAPPSLPPRTPADGSQTFACGNNMPMIYRCKAPPNASCKAAVNACSHKTCPHRQNHQQAGLQTQVLWTVLWQSIDPGAWVPPVPTWPGGLEEKKHIGYQESAEGTHRR